MPTLTVVGNCQAESLRRLLSSAGGFDSRRIAPVHELEREDMGWLGELLAGTDVLVAQPIRDQYRGLPVGTSQLIAQLPRGAVSVIVPVLRFDALMPYQAIIRDPEDPSLNPPVVPYHDLRLLAAAARGRDAALRPRPTPEALRRARDYSIEQIRSRERRHGTVVVSDYLETSPVWHTVNHPDNATLSVAAGRVLAALGIDADPVAPDYEMLGELDAPVDPEAAAALGVSVTGRDRWFRRGEGPLAGDEIVHAQLDFYRARPALVAHGMQRHAERLSMLGLA
ncbi:WcbI family polysaccharide biosynthesis putative acetyltransferase [Corynebacterium liangguodongii]|uniref:Polysaccharide biosynthesis enzyme WcbI domain-containing protein n=1 Tax=Corynebacterium liangguodongii TaxID=2079535 RepID=A0A2S0WFK2_9CORY|nr:WcbI family polysaccharide biosynthesis putative acetyltransferase [Corynebacterium liangguodongii]AWB84539.1 hypothetical protein C3E79_08620 [Corynebacterium liangguodongii]PWB98877.1 hypothetical protein DF219_09765 [Corynebacterium liangguodongii]